MTAEEIVSLPDDIDPAALFGLLWPSVELRVAQIIQEPWNPGQTTEFGLFYDRLINETGPNLPREFLGYLRGGKNIRWQTPAEEFDQRAFLIMRVIDRAFRLVLPETAYNYSGAICVKPGELLRRMRDRYLAEGCLARTERGYVALLGPLTSGMRSEAPDIRNGDVFEHQFVNLTLIPQPTAGRNLSFSTLPPSEFLPVAGAEEIVGVAPIAQDEHDLTFVTSERGLGCYLDARPGDSDKTKSRTIATVGTLLHGGARLIALPELAVDAETVGTVRANIRPGDHDGARVLVLGTGLSQETCGTKLQLRYNEAVVCDGRGRLLFRQRKLHHYSMAAARMRQCAIVPERDVAHVENSASGDELHICDLPGMGRLMVLICEDFAQPHPGRDVARRLSPDWIVTPILDVAITEGRWTHQKAFSLDTISKIVVSGSTTLSVRAAKLAQLDQLNEATGVAMFYDGRSAAASHIVTKGCLNGADACALVAWDSPSWRRVRMTLS